MNEEHQLKRIKIRRYGTGPSDLGKVLTAAKADNHSVLAPTHLIERDGEVIGCLEIASTPVVMVWMDSKKTKIRDSIRIMDFYEDQVGELLERNGRQDKQVIVPCSAKSPYLDYMKEIGYVDAGDFKLFIKKL